MFSLAIYHIPQLLNIKPQEQHISTQEGLTVILSTSYSWNHTVCDYVFHQQNWTLQITPFLLDFNGLIANKILKTCKAQYSVGWTNLIVGRLVYQLYDVLNMCSLINNPTIILQCLKKINSIYPKYMTTIQSLHTSKGPQLHDPNQQLHYNSKCIPPWIQNKLPLYSTE